LPKSPERLGKPRTICSPPVRFNSTAAATELRALAEAVRRIGDPSLKLTPHGAMRVKVEIAERLDRIAGEIAAASRG